MRLLISFIAGVIFAIGLVISGMTNPQKVLGFLDVLGDWDYSLAFVMVGAIGVNLISFTFIKKREQAWCGDAIDLPKSKLIDLRLVVGSALFGIGWGLLGVCPGPGIVNLVTLNPVVLLFVGGMVVGMVFYRLVLEKRS